MIEKTCCFTGHRVIEPGKIPLIKRELEKEIVLLIKSGYLYFETGGALGFDMIAAQTVLSLREKYAQIKLVLVLPCLSQTERWNASNKAIYEEIKKKADDIIYTSQEYNRGCMHKRNRYLIESSSICIAYLIKDFGGTVYTVKYAKNKGKAIINIAESILV